LVHTRDPSARPLEGRLTGALLTRGRALLGSNLEPKLPNAERPIQSSRLAFGCFSLLILNNRAAPSYQLLDLSLAVLPLDRLFLIVEPWSFEVGVLVLSFLDNCLPPQPDSTSSFDYVGGAQSASAQFAKWRQVTSFTISPPASSRLPCRSTSELSFAARH
jgi:hypothetical protein